MKGQGEVMILKILSHETLSVKRTFVLRGVNCSGIILKENATGYQARQIGKVGSTSA